MHGHCVYLLYTYICILYIGTPTIRSTYTYNAYRKAYIYIIHQKDKK